MEDLNWLEIIKDIGTIATPIILIGLSAIGWKIRKKVERELDIENKLRVNRTEIYKSILEPFIIILTPEVQTNNHKGKQKTREEKALEIMQSVEYRKKAFELVLIGNDNVLKSYNNLMQYFYNMGDKSDSKRILSLFGNFLLEIRKSTGNEKTELDNIAMIEWFIKDAKDLR